MVLIEIIFFDELILKNLFDEEEIKLLKESAVYDKELDKGIYTGHFSWKAEKIPVDKKHEYHAKIFEFNPKVLDGGKDKNK